ncbi:MAG: tetratricopeptide repeat protein [Limisphaerales bacterium]
MKTIKHCLVSCLARIRKFDNLVPMLDGLRRKQWLWGMLLMMLTCIVYLPVLRATFVWDDSFMIADNKMLRSTPGLHDIWFTNKPADHIPVTLTAIWLQWQLWGSNPVGFHVVNVLLHALGAVLLWRVLLRLRLPGAWLAAAVFALHPVCVASAAWVSEQKNTVSLVFYLWTVLCYLRFIEKPNGRNYAVVLTVFVLTLLTKGSVVVLPAVLLLLVWWKNREIKRFDLLRLIPFFVLAFAEALTAIWFQNHRAIGGEMIQDLNRAGQFVAATRAVWFYLWKAWVPWNIMVIYPQWVIDWRSVVEYLPALAIVAVLAVAWRFRATWGRHVVFALLALIVTLFPVMGFFNMYFLVFSRVADHWQYLALLVSIPFAVCSVAYLIRKAKWTASVSAGLAIAVLAFLSFSTWIRASVYQSEETLWTDTVARNPNAWMAYNNLGNAVAAKHDTDDSIKIYKQAVAIKPDFDDAHSNLGNALVAKYEELKGSNKQEAERVLDEAVDHLQRAVKLQPKMANFHFNYGIALVDKGRVDEGIKEYEAAIQIRSGFADCRNNLANALLKANRPKEALEQALIAGQINPNSAESHYNAGSAYHALGDVEHAKKEFETALSMRSNLASAHYECGMMLAMAGRFEDALPHFQAFVRAHPNDESGHGSLGNVYAALHRQDEAVSEYQAGLKLNPTDGQTENNLANVYMEQGKIPEALDHYARSVQLHGDDSGTHANYATALARAGKRAEAEAECREALRLRPNDPQLQAQLNALKQ